MNASGTRRMEMWMKTFEIKTLVLAAVACLPMACGTSVTGPDSGLTTVSALRAEPLPPMAPEAPSPEAEPAPADTTNIPVDDTTTPAAPRRNPNRPHTGVSPSPSPTPKPSPVEEPEAGVPEAPKCQVASIEINELQVLVATGGVSLGATLLDGKGSPVADSAACGSVSWDVSATQTNLSRGAARATPSADGLTMQVDGPAGDYKVQASLKNGVTDALVVTIR